MICDSVENLGHTGAKRVTLRGVEGVPGLEPVRDVKRTQDGISFLYGGKPDRLLQALSGLPVTDITIGEPDLEEIFLHYYAKGESENDSVST